MNDDSLNERAARMKRMKDASLKRGNPRGFDIGAATGIEFKDNEIDSARARGYLLGRQHERQLAGISKTLPRHCPQCNAISPWMFLTMELPGCNDIWHVKGYFCRYCAFAVELYQDTETLGRRKFVPVEEK